VLVRPSKCGTSVGTRKGESNRRNGVARIGASDAIVAMAATIDEGAMIVESGVESAHGATIHSGPISARPCWDDSHWSTS
jgi:hypothetical protein